jgi:hypothetical protein
LTTAPAASSSQYAGEVPMTGASTGNAATDSSGRTSGTRLHAVTPRVVLMLVRAEGSSRPDFAR